MSDPFDLAGQSEAQAQVQERAAIKRAQDDKDFMDLMGAPGGRRIVRKLLEQTGVFRTSYTGDVETYFREGARNVGLMWLADIHRLCPERYCDMMMEANANDD